LSHGRVTTVISARDKTLPVRKLLASLFLLVCAGAGCGSRNLAGQSSASDDAGPNDTATMSVVSPCAGGGVTFGLTAPLHSAGFFVLEAEPACFSSNWLKIYDSTGSELTIIHPPTTADCDTCSTMSFPSTCGTTTDTPAQIATMNWGAQFYPVGSCGAPSKACVQQKCVAPGHYVVAMCASDDQQGKVGHRCADVGFDYPTSNPVMGVLPPAQ
jgi:hypothetical protein